LYIIRSTIVTGTIIGWEQSSYTVEESENKLIANIRNYKPIDANLPTFTITSLEEGAIRGKGISTIATYVSSFMTVTAIIQNVVSSF